MQLKIPLALTNKVKALTNTGDALETTESKRKSLTRRQTRNSKTFKPHQALQLPIQPPKRFILTGKKENLLTLFKRHPPLMLHLMLSFIDTKCIFKLALTCKTLWFQIIGSKSDKK